MGYCIEDFQVGETFVSPGRTITEADLVAFSGLTWDTNPAHTDEEHAKKSPFGKRIAHGALTLSYATGLLAKSGRMDETAIAFLSIERWEFKGPVCPGDTIRLHTTTVAAQRSRSKPDRGAWTGELKVVNQRGEVCQQGLFTIMMKARGEGASDA